MNHFSGWAGVNDGASGVSRVDFSQEFISIPSLPGLSDLLVDHDRALVISDTFCNGTIRPPLRSCRTFTSKTPVDPELARGLVLFCTGAAFIASALVFAFRPLQVEC